MAATPAKLALTATRMGSQILKRRPCSAAGRCVCAERLETDFMQPRWQPSGGTCSQAKALRQVPKTKTERNDIRDRLREGMKMTQALTQYVRLAERVPCFNHCA